MKSFENPGCKKCSIDSIKTYLHCEVNWQKKKTPRVAGRACFFIYLGTPKSYSGNLTANKFVKRIRSKSTPDVFYHIYNSSTCSIFME